MNTLTHLLRRVRVVFAFGLCAVGTLYAELPKSFVEYVDSNDGDTYIDTGVTVNPALTRMRVALALNTTSGATAVFGRGKSWGDQNCAFVLMQSVQFRLDWLGNQVNKIDCVADKLYTFDLCGNAGTVNGVAYSTTVTKTNADSGENALLFSCYKGGVYPVAKMKLYSAAIWKDGTTLSGRYIPCIDNDDNAALYDMANDTIIYPKSKTNKSTTALTASTEASSSYRINEGKVQVRITVNATGEGTVDSESCWMDIGSTMTINATPASGKKAYWVRTLPDSSSDVKSEGASCSFTVSDCPVTVSCTFVDDDLVTPATYLQDAVNAAQDGATIKLMAAEFLLTNQLTIAKPITLVGAGRDLTTIKPAVKGDFRGVEMTNAGATIKNLTITGFQNTDSSKVIKGVGLYLTAGTADTVRVYKNANKKYNMAAGESYGAGICIGGGVVTNALIDGNYAESTYGNTTGVGVYMTGGLVVDSVISDNYRSRSQVYGAGVGIGGNGAHLLRCRIVNNSSKGNGIDGKDTRGMGIYMTKNGTVEQCEIVSNGISAVTMSDGMLKNCLVWGHSTTGVKPSGVEMSDGKLYNCTIAGNTDAGGYPGLTMTGGTAINNIISGNSGAGNAKVSGGTFMTNMVCASSVITTTKVAGNMTADPAFTNPAKGDYSIGFSSPAYDTGATLAGVTDDILGVSRPQGDAYDIGCYEYMPAAGELQVAILIPTADYPEDGTAKASARIAGGSGTYTCQWFVDGVEQAGQTGTSIEVTGLGAGYHDIKVIVSDGSITKESTRKDGFNIHPSVVYVDLNGENEYPYNTSAKAATSIKDALDAVWCSSDKPGTVNIAAGTYYLTSELLLAKAVRVIGAGRDATILNASKAGASRVAHLEDAQAMLRDLTLTGATNKLSGAGVYLGAGTLDTVRVTASHQNLLDTLNNCGAGIYMAGGVVTNSIIDGNRITVTYGVSRGVGIYMTSGLVVDSEIRDNTFYRGNGHQIAGIGVYMAGGTLRNCSVHDNRFASAYSNAEAGPSGNEQYVSGLGICMNADKALIENCYVYANSMNGVMIISGTMRNSLVYGHRDSALNYFAGVNLAGGKLLNCTISDNYASADSDGKSGLWMTGGTALNNIVYGNGNNDVTSCFIEGGTFKTNLTDNVEVADGSGNIKSNPNFVDAAERDFHLAKGSPAIDAGVDIGIYTDIEGRERPLGNGYEMGCYEYEPSKEVSVAISTTQSDILLGRNLTAKVAYENIEPETSTFTWVLTDAASKEVSRVSGEGAECASFAYTPDSVGSYTLALSVVYNDKTYDAESTVTFTVKPGEVYVALNGSDEAPYDTPEKATDDLNAALSALWKSSDATTIVHVAAGEYELGDAVSITMPVRILGAGRDATVLNCKGVPSTKRPMTLNDDAAILSDLTLMGATNSLAGVGTCARLEAGLMDNVRITKVFISHPTGTWWAQAGGLYISGGVATNMLIDSVATDTNYGMTQGLGVYMTGGLLTDSVVCSNKLNRAQARGVGVFMTDGTIRRTKIFDNTAWCAGDTYSSGLALYHGNNDPVKIPLVDSCEIRDNTSAAYMNCGIIRNSLIAGGNRTDGRVSGLLQEGGTVINCTIADNVSTGSNVADYSLVSPGVINNSIAVNATVTSGTTTNCLFNTDPKFVSPKSGIYRLKWYSPAIDAGDNDLWTWGDLETAKDVKGGPRLVNEKIDIGCYESKIFEGTVIFVK